MKKRVAINGFGRIGRLTCRQLLHYPDIEVVAVNDLTDIPTLAHLFKYDTAHRKYQGEVHAGADFIEIDGQQIKALAQKDPLLLPWKDLNIDIVLECTGIYLTHDTAHQHIQAGAKKVILSAPPKDSSIPIFVLGVNDTELNVTSDIISNASCTTNCLSPLIKIINDTWGIKMAIMNTIHAYTQDQRLQDAPHKDLRRARAAAMSIIPTSTGAAKAVEQVYPDIKGKLFASSYRVPVITGSLIELFCVLNTEVTVQDINNRFQLASTTTHQGLIEFNLDPLVSTDIIGNPHSAVFDAELTEAQGNYIKIVAWYDNEAGYSNRLANMCSRLANLLA